jgi:pyruvate,water dikinase
MLPMVRTVWEVKKCIEIMREEGLERSKDFKLWFMAETPSIAILADEFCKYCDGFSIGSNDMTQGILMIVNVLSTICSRSTLSSQGLRGFA